MRLLPLAWLFMVLSCSRGENVPRVWQPSDHDHTSEPVPAATGDSGPAAQASQSQSQSVGQDASGPPMDAGR
jgi:hypothetical protein